MCLESQKAAAGGGRGCGESKKSKMYPHAPIKPLLNQVGSNQSMISATQDGTVKGPRDHLALKNI